MVERLAEIVESRSYAIWPATCAETASEFEEKVEREESIESAGRVAALLNKLTTPSAV